MDRQYKDSRIKWIGSIPESWKIYRIKYNTFLKGRIGWQGLNSNDFIDEGYCLITGTDFDNKGGINWNTCYRISKERFDEDELLHIKNGDLLMTKDGTIGKMAYIDNLPEEASLNSHLLIIRQITNLMNNKYLYWVMLSDVFVQFYNLFQSGTTMGSISQSTLGLFSTPCPPIPEQLRIANYLEEKCGEIDSLIGIQEQMIEKLKAYKQSVITEAVTKGLNSNAKLVSSGIDWIGEIPEGWEIAQLKRFLTFQNGQDYKAIETKESEGFPVYGSGGVFAYAAKYMYNGESVLFGRKGTVNKPLYVNCCFWTVDTMYYTIPSEACNCKFMYYVATTLPYDKYSTSTALPSMTQSILGNLMITIPPIAEQQAIASYLDKKCSEIDKLIDVKQLKIEKLKDYKKSVIYEAVTGKINIES